LGAGGCAELEGDHATQTIRGLFAKRQSCMGFSE